MQGNTAAHHAVREGHSGVLALLIRKGADLSVQNFQTSEYAQGNWLSAGWCRAWGITRLLDLPATLSVLLTGWVCILHLAGPSEPLRLGPAPMSSPAMPRCSAASPHLGESSHLLLSSFLALLVVPVLAGQQLTPLHQTPLHLAVEAGDGALATQLLEGGAPVSALDFDKKSALHLALEMQVGCASL